MKKLILSLAMLTATIAFAQKKEIANAVKAVDSGDLTTANSELSKAEGMFGEKTYLLEPSVLEQYYYAKGLSLLKSGKSTEGAEYLAKINTLGSEDIYSGKDADKNKVYFVGKEASEKFGNGISLKQEKFTPSLAEKVRNTINPQLQAASAMATTNYNNKKYDVAGEKFAETYYLFKAAGQDNKNYLYYAGVAYAQTESNKAKGIEVLNELIKSNYTGVETNYTAKNKKTGNTENLDKSAYELYQKMKDASDYSDFKIEKTPSKQEELYEILASLLFDQQKFEEAAVISDDGLKKFPNNKTLSQIQGNAYYKSGKTEQFVSNLKAQLAKNPTDKVNWYNLGVLQLKDPSMQKDAEESLKKALEIDPNFSNALQNMVYFYMGDDTKTVEEYNKLRKSGKIDAANKLMEERRSRFSKAIPYAEKYYSNNPNDKDMVSILKGLYMTTQNTAKYNEFKAKEAAMK